METTNSKENEQTITTWNVCREDAPGFPNTLTIKDGEVIINPEGIASVLRHVKPNRPDCLEGAECIHVLLRQRNQLLYASERLINAITTIQTLDKAVSQNSRDYLGEYIHAARKAVSAIRKGQ